MIFACDVEISEVDLLSWWRCFGYWVYGVLEYRHFSGDGGDSWIS